MYGTKPLKFGNRRKRKTFKSIQIKMTYYLERNNNMIDYTSNSQIITRYNGATKTAE